MKFRVTFKDPDVVHDACEDAIKDDLAEQPGMDETERELLLEHRTEKLTAFASKWVEYGEYITVEFDTEAQTAIVVPK